MKKKILFFILLLVLGLNCGVVLASEIVPIFNYGFSDNYLAEFKYSIKTSDGGVAGVVNVNPKEFGIDSSSTMVDSVVKMNSENKIEWIYPFRISTDYYFTDVVEDNNHNLVLVGKKSYNGKYDMHSKAAFLVVNNKGEKVKEVEIKTSNESTSLNSLTFDGEYYYVVGCQKNDVLLSEDSDYFYLRRDEAYGLYKFTSDFSLVWFKEFDKNSYEWKKSKHWGASGDYVIRNSSIDITPDGDIVIAYDYKKNNKIEIVKYDKNGNILFDKKIGGTEFSSSYDTDSVYSLVATEDNGVVAVGRIQSMGSIDRLGDSDAFYLKLDKDGNIVFEKYLIGVETDSISLVDCYYDNYVMVGSASSDIEGTDIKKGDFMMIVDKKGNILNVRSITNEIEVSYDSIFVNDSKIYLTGYVDNSNPEFSTIVDKANLIAIYSLKYAINVIDTSNVSISVVDSAMAGEEVEFTVSLEDGYVFKGLEDIEITHVKDNTYKFIMPSRDIDLKPIIEKDKVLNPNTSDICIAMLVLITFLVGGISFYNYKKIK